MVAVVAHSLLSSMAVIAGAADTLRERADRLSPEQTSQLLDMIGGQASHVSGVLRDLVLGLPADALAALEGNLAR